MSHEKFCYEEDNAPDKVVSDSFKIELGFVGHESEGAKSEAVGSYKQDTDSRPFCPSLP